MRRLLPPATLPVMALLLLAAVARCEEGALSTVAVTPFQVFNAPDVAPSAPGLQAALASRLSGPGIRVLTPAPGEAPDAEWTVQTSLTRLGSRMTLDASLEPRTPGRRGLRTFQTVESVDGLLPALDAVAAALRPGLAPAPTAAPSPAGPAAPPAATGDSGAGSSSGLGQAFLRYRSAGRLKGDVRGLAVADADGDGAPEVVALFDDRLAAFRDDGTELKPAWERRVEGFETAAYLSAGDADGDGTPELFVAGLDTRKAPLTRVYQWAGGALAERVPALNAFARIVPHPVRGNLLLGMVPGVGKDLFGPKQFAFEWNGKEYAKRDAVTLPEGVSVINAEWIAASAGDPLLVATGATGKFRIYDAAGGKLYESDEELKGGATVLFGEEKGKDRGDGDLFRVEPRTLAWKGPDGAVQVLVHKNYGTVARIFQRSADFTHGQWRAFRWDGLTLLPTAEGPKMPGYFSALELGPSKGRPGRQTLYTALVQDEGILFVKRTTRILAVDL